MLWLCGIQLVRTVKAAFFDGPVDVNPTQARNQDAAANFINLNAPRLSSTWICGLASQNDWDATPVET
jgi:hypothetical protein